MIGYGLAGRVFHGRLLAATPGMRVVAIVTSNPERQAEARADFPQATVHATVEGLWADSSAIDLVVVATSTPSHQPLAIAAIEVGKHVLIEKPMTATSEQARGLLERAQRRGVQLVPFLNRRWDSDHLTLRRLLREDALGTVLRYESRFDRWRPEPRAGAWREEVSSAAGGGVLLDLGPHLVDQALALHGPVSEVYAEIDARRGGADDDVFIALRHVGGVVSHLWANALAAAPGPRLRVLGSRAAYVVQAVDGQEDALRGGDSPLHPDFGVERRDHWGRLVAGDDSSEVPSERGNWLHVYTALAACLRGEGPPPVTAAEAIAGTRSSRRRPTQRADRHGGAPGSPRPSGDAQLTRGACLAASRRRPARPRSRWGR